MAQTISPIFSGRVYAETSIDLYNIHMSSYSLNSSPFISLKGFNGDIETYKITGSCISITDYRNVCNRYDIEYGTFMGRDEMEIFMDAMKIAEKLNYVQIYVQEDARKNIIIRIITYIITYICKQTGNRRGK